MTVDGVASILSLPGLQDESPDLALLRGHTITAVFRSQRILVNKTPNFTLAAAIG